MNTDPVQAITGQRYKSSFEKHLGVKFHKYCDGCCEISFTVEEVHLNIAGALHGGVINALCDIALSGAVTSNFIEKAESVVTLQMNVYFLKAGMLGDELTAFAEVTKKGRTICYVEGGIKNQNGDLIAKANGNWFIKS